MYDVNFLNALVNMDAQRLAESQFDFKKNKEFPLLEKQLENQTTEKKTAFLQQKRLLQQEKRLGTKQVLDYQESRQKNFRNTLNTLTDVLGGLDDSTDINNQIFAGTDSTIQKNLRTDVLESMQSLVTSFNVGMRQLDNPSMKARLKGARTVVDQIANAKPYLKHPDSASLLTRHVGEKTAKVKTTSPRQYLKTLAKDALGNEPLKTKDPKVTITSNDLKGLSLASLGPVAIEKAFTQLKGKTPSETRHAFRILDKAIELVEKNNTAIAQADVVQSLVKHSDDLLKTFTTTNQASLQEFFTKKDIDNPKIMNDKISKIFEGVIDKLPSAKKTEKFIKNYRQQSLKMASDNSNYSLLLAKNMLLNLTGEKDPKVKEEIEKAYLAKEGSSTAWRSLLLATATQIHEYSNKYVSQLTKNSKKYLSKLKDFNPNLNDILEVAEKSLSVPKQTQDAKTFLDSTYVIRVNNLHSVIKSSKVVSKEKEQAEVINFGKKTSSGSSDNRILKMANLMNSSAKEAISTGTLDAAQKTWTPGGWLESRAVLFDTERITIGDEVIDSMKLSWDGARDVIFWETPSQLMVKEQGFTYSNMKNEVKTITAINPLDMIMQITNGIQSNDINVDLGVNAIISELNVLTTTNKESTAQPLALASAIKYFNTMLGSDSEAYIKTHQTVKNWEKEFVSMVYTLKNKRYTQKNPPRETMKTLNTLKNKINKAKFFLKMHYYNDKEKRIVLLPDNIVGTIMKQIKKGPPLKGSQKEEKLQRDAFFAREERERERAQGYFRNLSKPRIPGQD